MTREARLTNLIEVAGRAANVLRMDAIYKATPEHLQTLAADLDRALGAFVDAEESRPIVGDRVKIAGGEYSGFTGTYLADRDNGTARYPVVKLASGVEVCVPDPLHLRKL